MRWLRGAARRGAGQRGGRKSVGFVVHLGSDESVTVGGADGYAALARSWAEGDDPFAWLNGQIQGRYVTLYTSECDIGGVDLTIF